MSEERPGGMNKKQLASLYKCDRRTLNKWLKPFLQEIGRTESNIYTPRQVLIIQDKIGPPPN